MAQTAEIIKFESRRPVVVADTDDGWFKTSTALSEALCRIDMCGQEWKVFNCVKHKTLAYKKTADWIAASQFSEMTGIPARKISEIKNRLIERKILTVDGKKVGINLVVSEWQEKPKRAAKSQKAVPLKEVKNTPISDSNTPKRGEKNPQIRVHNKKDNIQKKDKDIVGKPDDSIDIKSVLDYLNLRTGKNFRPVKSNLSLISARLGDGYSLQDLKTVIDKKTMEWLGDEKMEDYLRPITLFSASKFDGYLNAAARHRPTFKRNSLDWQDTSWADDIGVLL